KRRRKLSFPLTIPPRRFSVRWRTGSASRRVHINTTCRSALRNAELEEAPMRTRIVPVIAATLAAIAFLDARAPAQPSFTPLGDLPGGAVVSKVWGISADGSTVVGDSIIAGTILFSGKYAAFAWTAKTGLQDIYHLEGSGTICRAYAANATGSM